MGAVPEDPSFLIYAAIHKGFSAARVLNSAVAIVHKQGVTSEGETVFLRDDGLCTLMILHIQINRE